MQQYKRSGHFANKFKPKIQTDPIGLDRFGLQKNYVDIGLEIFQTDPNRICPPLTKIHILTKTNIF